MNVLDLSSPLATELQIHMRTISPAPNLLLVGGPKCGTTSLLLWLRKHPEIYHPWARHNIDVVESGFLLGGITDLPFEPSRPRGTFLVSHETDMDYYRNEKFVIDKSPQHLYSDRALSMVAELMPDAKVVITIRNPYDLFVSYHFMQLNKTMYCQTSMNELIGQLNDINWAPTVDDYQTWAFVSYPRYSKRVISWIQKLGEERVRVIPLDSMVENPRKVLESLALWIGVDPNAMPGDLGVQNPRGAFPQSKFHRFLRSPPNWIFKLSHILLPSRDLRKVLLDPIRRIGWRHVPAVKPEISPEDRKLICEKLSEDIEFFENLEKYIPASTIIR